MKTIDFMRMKPAAISPTATPREEAVETVTALAKDAFVTGSAGILTVDVVEGGKPYLRISVSLDVSDRWP